MTQSAQPPQRWERLGSRTLASTRILDLKLTGYRHPQRKTEREFVLIDVPDWVNVLAVTPQLEMVLVRQFRYGIDDFSLEIPGGVVDRGEDPLAAGLRELREETGFSGGESRLLGRVRPNPATQNNHCHFVLATGVTRSAALEWDEDEEIEVLLRPVAEVYAMAGRGEISHALVLDALLLFLPVWERLRQGAV